MTKRRRASTKRRSNTCGGCLVIVVIGILFVIFSSNKSNVIPSPTRSSTPPSLSTSLPNATATNQQNASSRSILTSTPISRPPAAATQTSLVLYSSPRTYYIIGSSSINARSCEKRSCDIVTTYEPGASISVNGEIQGDPVNGSTKWYRISYQNTVVYIHSSLLSSTKPAAQSPGSSLSSQPAAQPISTPVPQQSVPDCPGFEFVCEQLTCAQAYACLAAGNQQLDGNKDGIPCNKQCG